MPIWLHSLLRFFAPLPSAVLLATGVIMGIVRLAPPGEKKGIYVLVCIGVGIVCAVIGWLLPRIVLRRLVPARCPQCRTPCQPAPRSDQDFVRYFCHHCSAEQTSPVNPVTVMIGLFLLLFGVVMIVLPVMEEPTGGDAPPWLVLVIGIILTIIALLTLGLWRPALAFLTRWFPSIRNFPWGFVLGTTLATGIGLMFICIGILSKDTSNMPCGRVPVVAAGAAFFLFGLISLVGMLRPNMPTPVAMVLISLLLLAFAAAPVGIMIHEAGSPKGLIHPVPIISVLAILGILVLIWYKFLQQKRRKKPDLAPAEPCVPTQDRVPEEKLQEQKRDVGKKRTLRRLLWWVLPWRR